MSRTRPSFVDYVLRQQFSSIDQPVATLPWAAVEMLLVDDGERRVALGRRIALAAVRAGSTPVAIELVADHLLVTGAGLIYVARLRDAPGEAARSERPEAEANEPARREYYYAATPGRMLDRFVDHAAALTRQAQCVIAIDGRLGRELDFAWPIDTGLRRQLGAHEVLVAR